MSASEAYPRAAQWLVNLLLGPAANAVAVVAIALFGLAMLQGRVSMRKGVRLVLGAFILFGAPVIAQGLLAGGGTPGGQEVSVSSPPEPILSDPLPPVRPISPFDPYAGGAMPS